MFVSGPSGGMGAQIPPPWFAGPAWNGAPCQGLHHLRLIKRSDLIVDDRSWCKMCDAAGTLLSDHFIETRSSILIFPCTFSRGTPSFLLQKGLSRSTKWRNSCLHLLGFRTVVYAGFVHFLGGEALTNTPSRFCLRTLADLHRTVFDNDPPSYLGPICHHVVRQQFACEDTLEFEVTTTNGLKGESC